MLATDNSCITKRKDLTCLESLSLQQFGFEEIESRTSVRESDMRSLVHANDCLPNCEDCYLRYALFFLAGGGADGCFYAAENSNTAQISFTYRRETEITNCHYLMSPTPKLLSQTFTVQTKQKVFLHKSETCIFISVADIYFPVGQCSYF